MIGSKVLIFILATAAYAVLAYLIALGLQLQCGLGSDAPAACNDVAGRQTFSFVVGAIVFYLVLSVGYWWRREHSKG